MNVGVSQALPLLQPSGSIHCLPAHIHREFTPFKGLILLCKTGADGTLLHGEVRPGGGRGLCWDLALDTKEEQEYNWEG